jgi:glycine/D-amino acid oxidase-like deaminating enzyme
MIDLIVVGAGIMGSAAARHAALAGASVLIIGEPEPISPAQHDGLFGAWHDVSRLASRLHGDPDDAELSRRSMLGIAELEADGAEQILSPVGYLYAAAPGFDTPMRQRLAVPSGLDVETLSAVELHQRYPSLSFGPAVSGYFEPSPSGYLNPRRLVHAQLTAAVTAGATLLRETAQGVELTATGVVVRAGGREHVAARAVLCTGAFSNTTAFLPRPLALRLKTETVLLSELTEASAAPYTQMPVVHYEIDSPTIASIYCVPPLTMPDGKILMKFGANSRHDVEVHTDAVANWYQSGPSDRALGVMRQACQAMFPGLEAVDSHTARCVITYTPTRNPIIDTLVEGRLFAAIGGNGHSAKWCDGIGGLAASLALHGTWVDPTIGPDRFRAQFADESQQWDLAKLVSERE